MTDRIKPGKKLTGSQKIRYREFAEEYIKDFNRGNAYRRCTWTDTNSYHAAAVAASNLIANGDVQQMIQDAIEAKHKDLGVSKEAVVFEQARLAFSDIRNYIEWTDDGIKFKDSAILDKDVSRAIESFEMSEIERPDGSKTRKTRIKLHNKGTALDSLGKHLGLYTEKREVNVNYGTINVPALAEPKDWMDVVRQEIEHVNGNGDGGTSKEHMAGE